MAITRSLSSQQRAEPLVMPKKESILVPRNHGRYRICKQQQASQGAQKSARRPSAQLRAELEDAVSRITPAKEHAKAPQFLFVPFPDIMDIAEEPHLAIDASNTSDRFLARYPMYNTKNMSMIQQELGKGFASYGMTSTKPYYEIPILHQGVVTMQHLSHSFNRDVTFRSWKWLQAQLKMVTARPQITSSGKAHHQPTRKPASHPRKVQQHALFTDPNTPCIIFLHWTTDPGPPTADLTAIYSTIQTLQSSHPSRLIRAFPSASEIHIENLKIPDIQALDHIASTAPEPYAYRPHTCLTHASPTHDITMCPLRTHSKIIMKRTHSSSGQHVQLVSGCLPLPHHLSSPSNQQQQHTWFAQSYEPIFAAFGEFRIFITATSSPSSSPLGSPPALRSRHPRILSTIITEWVLPTTDPSEMYARVATAQDFQSPHISPLTLNDLHAFALYVYARLRGREDWEVGYESLEVGVRLDVGVGKGKKQKRFFVNEITRFYAADFFSQHTLGAPQQEVCWGFAEAVDGYFGGGEGEVKEEEEGEGKGEGK